MWSTASSLYSTASLGRILGSRDPLFACATRIEDAQRPRTFLSRLDLSQGRRRDAPNISNARHKAVLSPQAPVPYFTTGSKIAVGCALERRMVTSAFW